MFNEEAENHDTDSDSIFLEVCQTMNFTKAASNLFVAQPSLSRQIQMLETELGVQLLVRSNRNVVLTDAGEVFKREFTKISGAIEVAIHKIQEAGTQKKGDQYRAVAGTWGAGFIRFDGKSQRLF